MTQLQTRQQTICIIDDDKIQHFTLQKSLQLQGLKKNLICFNDGEEALTFFSQNSEDGYWNGIPQMLWDTWGKLLSEKQKSENIDVIFNGF